jgi:arsenite-transporting ATPase
MNASLTRLDKEQRRLIMIGGKGGVGKTTCASSIALHFSLQGKKTLIISSDPTPSLSDIFEMEIGDVETPIKNTKNLYGIEISSGGLEEMERAIWPGDLRSGFVLYITRLRLC